LSLEGLAGYDGVRWTGQGKAHWSLENTEVAVEGEYLEGGFYNLRSGTGLAGARYLRLSADGNLTEGLSLRGSSSWRRWEPAELDITNAQLLSRSDPNLPDANPWRDQWDDSVRVIYDLGQHLTATAWWKLTDTEISDPHWRRLRGGTELSVQDPNLSKRLSLGGGLSVAWENVNERAGSPIEATYKWNTMRFRADIAFSNRLTLGGLIERRFTPEDSPAEPSGLIWQAVTSGHLPGLGPVASGQFSATYVKWEHLNTLDGTFSTGRHISTWVELRTHSWHGLSLDAQGNWKRNPDEDTDNITLQVGLVSQLGFGDALGAERSGIP
jgi:hypothetical protein